VVGSSLQDPLRQATNDVSHVVRLSSMDDDGWGENSKSSGRSARRSCRPSREARATAPRRLR
jgi:hypothetical protein